MEPEYVLVLRTCAADLTSFGGFRWPASGPVKALDWDPAPRCGHGLHGFLWGEGDGGLASWAEDARWLVVRVLATEIVDLGGKVKFPQGEVIFCGDRLGATTYIATHGGAGRAIIGGTATAGVRGAATAGYHGTATAGDHGTATAADRGTATAGYGGTATAGVRGAATAGVGGTATAGDRGTATAGDHGTATAGYGGTATAGYRGTATAGDGGTATAGVRGAATAGVGGTATAGDRGTATAGYHGELRIRWWDGQRYRTGVFCVGEAGVEPGVAYRLDDAGRIVRAGGAS
jgi:hypothetical protein